MQITREELFNIIDEISYISEEPIESTRWGTLYEMIFKKDDRYWSVTYETVPEEGIQIYGDEIDCEEVFPVEVTSVQYLTAKELEKRNKK